MENTLRDFQHSWVETRNKMSDKEAVTLVIIQLEPNLDGCNLIFL